MLQKMGFGVESNIDLRVQNVTKEESVEQSVPEIETPVSEQESTSQSDESRMDGNSALALQNLNMISVNNRNQEMSNEIPEIADVILASSTEEGISAEDSDVTDEEMCDANLSDSVGISESSAIDDTSNETELEIQGKDAVVGESGNEDNEDATEIFSINNQDDIQNYISSAY